MVEIATREVIIPGSVGLARAHLYESRSLYNVFSHVACPDEVGEKRAQYIIHGAAPGYRGLSNTHPHKGSPVPVVKGSTHKPHRSESYLSSRSTLSVYTGSILSSQPGPHI